MHKNAVWSGIVEGLFVYFIDPLHPKDFFARESIYNQPDDFDRFTYFSRAALEFLSQFGKRPNVIHLHDWPVAMVVCNDPVSIIWSWFSSCKVVKSHLKLSCWLNNLITYFILFCLQAPLYRSLHAGLGFNSRIAFTCHNIESQGKGSKEALEACGVQFKEPLNKEHFQDNVSPDKINIMKVIFGVRSLYSKSLFLNVVGRISKFWIYAELREFVFAERVHVLWLRDDCVSNLCQRGLNTRGMENFLQKPPKLPITSITTFVDASVRNFRTYM